MNRQISLLVLTALVSVSALAQTELMMKRFRFQKHTSAEFERLVLEFTGPAVQEEVEVKASMSGAEKDVSLMVKNAQLVGAVPESTINESLQDSRKWMGPLTFSTDMPKNGFTLRTLLKNSEAQVDAFWLSQPTRLVVDVYPKTSPRANSRTSWEVKRSVASTKESVPVVHKTPKMEMKPSAESIYCFPVESMMMPSVAFSPWKGSNVVNLAVKDPFTPKEEMQEAIVCYPAQSRVQPQVSFSNAASEPAKPMTLGATTGGPEPRTPASEAEAKPQFQPKPDSQVPPSLGANFEKAQKAANPATLLPPYK